MKLQFEVAVIETSVLLNMVEKCVKNYVTEIDDTSINHFEVRRVVGTELDRMKEDKLISFYGTQTQVEFNKVNEVEKK